jgi:hypothetical protein
MSDHSTTLRWRRSTYCSSGGCIEVACEPCEVHVRDTTDPEGPSLVVSIEAWRGFIESVKRGDLDHT